MDSTIPSATARRPAPPLATIAARAAASAAANGRTPASTRAAEASAAAGSTTTSQAAGDDDFGFLDVLSMLNPLQYLPVVGSIYRAVTGDTIPEGVRDIGSLAISAVTGGPMGVAISAAATALEKLVGFDPDRIATKVLASLGIISDDSKPQLAATDAASPQSTNLADARAVPWTRAQRVAYAPAAQGQRIIAAPSRQPEIAAPAGVTALSEAAQRQAAAAAYTRRTLSGIEPLIRERIAGHST